MRRVEDGKMHDLRSDFDRVVVRPCLQCGAAVTFDLAGARVTGQRTARVTSACRACAAVHRLLVDWDVYGLVQAGSR